jgi:signal transduction histidine kinase
MRRGTPEVVVAALLALLLVSYVWYTQFVIRELRVEGARSIEMFARVTRGLADDKPLSALIDIQRLMRAHGIPMIWVSPDGAVADHANLPFDPQAVLPEDDPRITEYIPRLQAQNTPIVDPQAGTIYFGNTRLVRQLRVIPMLQALTGVVLLIAFVYIVRTRSQAAREHVWAGMARESAHQLGTPLSSLTGWLELLEDRAENDPSLGAAVKHMQNDLVRLDRVAHRFERIGREPKLEQLDVGVVVDRVASYFKARVPTLANTVAVQCDISESPKASGDPVLLEWALEVLTKNAIDALAGRGGTVRITAAPVAEGGARIRVADDGPGVPREIRQRIFEPGFTTKQTGWGIGLSLAKRIIEENHGGKLMLLPTDRGATFEIILT